MAEESVFGGLEYNLNILVQNLVVGSHWWDELPKVRELDRMLDLGLSDQGIKELQLDVLFRSMMICVSEEHLQQRGYTHLTRADVIKGYINKIYEYGCVQSLKEAEDLVKSALRYYELKGRTQIPPRG